MFVGRLTPDMLAFSFYSSYGLAPDQEVFLKPRKLFKDPFRQGEHLLVLCDSFLANVRYVSH